MAKRRTYKRDKRGRFAATGTSRVKRIGRKINRRRPRYVGAGMVLLANLAGERSLDRSPANAVGAATRPAKWLTHRLA